MSIQLFGNYGDHTLYFRLDFVIMQRYLFAEVEMSQPYSMPEHIQVDKVFTGVATSYEQQISAEKMGGRNQTTRRT